MYGDRQKFCPGTIPPIYEKKHTKTYNLTKVKINDWAYIKMC